MTDDEEGMRAGVERTLRDEKFCVPDVDAPIVFVIDQAETGEIAVDKIDSETPIYAVGSQTAGLSGLDVLDHIARSKHEVFTVMLTAYASLENGRHGNRERGVLLSGQTVHAARDAAKHGSESGRPRGAEERGAPPCGTN